ncbi:hypothetical protein BS47DRAFT_1293697 [Hydnum rufescens UP504]|uniref:Uncharacterized protein n=1 Tax=Hydnum rufescens UP504 TaxID=1448309 RepID=A0A9P6DVP0_9AGAM|nr:hypothetical protein BS47DRAFT_1293697 [Hydnum rufescens UP504]
MHGNHRHVPDPQKELVLTMLESGMKPSQVRAATQLGLNTIYCLRNNWKLYGRVSRPALAPGRPRKLNSMELDYLESLIELQPDIYVDEMKDTLRRVLGVFVSGDTIVRALKQWGFTRKRVHIRYFWSSLFANSIYYVVAHKASL